LPHTIIGENVWIENAVVGSQTQIMDGVIIVSKDADAQLMVVGHNEIINPARQDFFEKNKVISVVS